MTNYNSNDNRFDGRCFLEDVEIKLQKRLEEIGQSLSDGQKEIDNMQEYYWENYTEMDEYGYEDYDNQQALLHQVNANNEKLQLKHRFEKMLDAMVQSDAEIAYCNFLLEYEFKPNESPYRNSGDIVIRDSKNVLQDMMMEKVSCSACTKLYKSGFLTSLQFPEGKNYEDRLVMYEWVALCKKVVWVDSPFYHYVERQTSICHTMSPMNLYHYFLAEYARMRFMEKYSLFEEEDLFKIRTRLIGTCLTIFKEILLKVNLREFKEPVKDMRQKMKEIAALPEDTYELKYRRRVRKIAYHWHLYYLTHFLFKKGGDS